MRREIPLPPRNDPKPAIVPRKRTDKLVFVEYLLSLRASAHTGVAIPRLEGKCIDDCPTEQENLAIFVRNRYLVPLNGGIATPVCALVRNDSVFSAHNFKHQFVMPPDYASRGGKLV